MRRNQTHSIYQYILHQQRTQFIWILSILYILMVVLLFSSVHYLANRTAIENNQFISNYVQQYFENYHIRSQVYHQDQNIRNVLRYANDYPDYTDSPNQISRHLSQSANLPSDLSLYASGIRIWPQSSAKQPISPAQIAELKSPHLFANGQDLYYFIPYFNFTQSKILGSLCYRISSIEFQTYIEQAIPRPLSFSLADTSGNIFYQTAQNHSVHQYTAPSSNSLFLCTVYFSLSSEYQTITLLLGLLLIVCILSFLFAIFYSARIANRIAAPINQLIAAIHNNQSGELVQSNFISSGLEEIDELTAAYEDLLIRIQKLLVQNHKENLLRMESKLGVLQDRINPHFLFNTLELISSQAILEDAEKTSILTQKLGTLFRYSLRAPDIIPMRQEIQYAKDYLYLQNVRYNEQIHYEVLLDTCPPDFLLPKLTLQPILENCFQHGFSDETDEKHQIILHGTREENELVIIITDNGSGLTEEKCKEINLDLRADKNNFAHFIQRCNHIGLRNVNARLCLHFQIEQALYIAPSTSGGTQVTLRLPLTISTRNKEETPSCLPF